MRQNILPYIRQITFMPGKHHNSLVYISLLVSIVIKPYDLMCIRTNVSISVFFRYGLMRLLAEMIIDCRCRLCQVCLGGGGPSSMSGMSGRGRTVVYVRYVWVGEDRRLCQVCLGEGGPSSMSGMSG